MDGLEQGFPTPGLRTGAGPQPVRSRAAQQEVSGEKAKLHLRLPIAPHHSHHRLNHHPMSMEKLSFTKPVPGAKKVGDRWIREYYAQ